MHRLHSALTIAVPIKEGRAVELRALLKRLQPVRPKSRKPNLQVTDRSSSNNQGMNGDTDLWANGNRTWTVNDVDTTNNASERDFAHWGTNNTPSSGVVIISAGNSEREPAGANPANIGEAFRSETQGQTRNIISPGTGSANNNTTPVERNATPVISDGPLKVKKTDAELNDMNQAFNFDASDTILFVTGVLLPAQHYCNETLPATLVFATTYVGTLSNHLDDLIKTNRDGLCEIFKHCEDFPEGRWVNDKELINYIKEYRQRSAFNSRYSCITKQDVKREKELRMEIEDYLDKANDHLFLNGQQPNTVKKLIERHIKAQGDKFRWAQKPEKDNVYEMLTKKRGIISLVLIGMIIYFLPFFIWADSMDWFSTTIISIGLIISIPLIALMILFLIARQKSLTAGRPPDDHVRRVAATQLRPVINEMTAAAPLKKGWLRRHFYSFALRVVNLGCHELMQIPTVSSIRWLSIDNKKRLLFLSNYSNTTDFYVREFLTGKTPLGVNFMFTNGCGFPDAKLLRWEGIKKDPEGYMNVIHTHQHPAGLWYSHEYDLTIDQILRNRKLRNGLFKKMNMEDTTRWLQLL